MKAFLLLILHPSAFILPAAAVIACAIVTENRPELTPIDQSLPFLAILIALLGYFSRRFEILYATIPLFVFSAIAIADERARLLVYGLLFASAALVALLGLGAAMERWRAVGLVLVVTTVLRAISPSIESLFPTILLMVGLAALTMALSPESVGRHVIPIVIAVALVTPLVPVRAAFFPLLLAFLVVFARSRSLVVLAVAFVVAAIAGKWALLLFALGSIPLFLLPTLALAAVAIFLRPALALLYFLAAVVLFLLPGFRLAELPRLFPGNPAPRQLGNLLMIPVGALVFLWLVMFPWSGAIAPAFPLPLALPKPEVESQNIGRALAAGEAMVIRPEKAAVAMTLIASGSNITALRPGTSLGRVEFVDHGGHAFRRDLVVGEIADWGAFRPAHFFATRNRLPDQPAPRVEGYGSAAFLAGLGRVELSLEQPIAMLHVTASPDLPANARLEVHRIETPRQ